jgi:SAM-dependent methyltransferase
LPEATVSTDTVPSISPESPAAAQQLLFQLTTGYIISSALQVAVSLRIADALADGPRYVGDLARAAGANADALYRVLRTLASAGVFVENAPREFGNNVVSEQLRSGRPGMYDMALWMSDSFHLQVYADIMHSVMTGQPAVEKTVGVPVFEHFPKNPELSERFNNAMTAFSASVIPAVLEAYDFSGIKTLVDVAGGHGQVLTSILQAYPAMHGVLGDLAHVLAGAEPRIRALGLSDRCRVEVIDFFKAVPARGDAYIMKHIIHDWDDDRAVTILDNIRRAMNPGGRVILLESVLLPANQPDFGKVIDIEMLLMPGGRERTEDEFRALFERAGFRLTRIVPTKSPLSVIEAK